MTPSGDVVSMFLVCLQQDTHQAFHRNLNTQPAAKKKILGQGARDSDEHRGTAADV